MRMSQRDLRDSGTSRGNMYPEKGSIMFKENFPVADIYVPVKRRASLSQPKVDEIAASMLEEGQKTPILVRQDGTRLVLVEGLHRLEAAKALGEQTIVGYRVQARKH
jgi:sulfiredoxin